MQTQYIGLAASYARACAQVRVPVRIRGGQRRFVRQGFSRLAIPKRRTLPPMNSLPLYVREELDDDRCAMFR